MRKIAVTGTRGIPDILGGVETVCEELYPRIAAHGYDVTLIRRASYVHDRLSEYKGVKLIDLKAPKRKSFEAIVHTLRAVLTARFRLKAGILHIHAIGPALVTPLARLLGLKVVFTHHGPDYDRDKWNRTAKFMLRLGERMGVRYAHEVIVISPVIDAHIRKKYNRQDASLIYNGVPQPNVITGTHHLDSLGLMPQQYIFAMGRFVPEKNFHQLINAFSALSDKRRCRLVIAGDADFEDAYSRDLKNLARRNDVVLTGFIKGEKLHALLSHARAFVLPSSHEGMPVALLEAMSYNLPLLVSDIPAHLALGLPNDAYFRIAHEEMLSAKLSQLLDEIPARPTYALEPYHWDHIAEQTIKVYSKFNN